MGQVQVPKFIMKLYVEIELMKQSTFFAWRVLIDK